jgi:hypothetical protein
MFLLVEAAVPKKPKRKRNGEITTDLWVAPKYALRGPGIVNLMTLRQE